MTCCNCGFTEKAAQKICFFPFQISVLLFLFLFISRIPSSLLQVQIQSPIASASSKSCVTSAEEYTPPAEDSTQTVTDSEETHEVVQVQGVQTYDPTLYEKLDTLQESLNTLIDIMTPAETGTEDAQSGEPAQDYTAQLETISGQLVDLRTAAEMATAETAQPAAFEKPFADYSVSEVLLLVLAAVVVGAIVIGLVRGF